MSKRIIGIIVGAVLLLGLVALAWLWYLGRSTESGTNTTATSNTPVVNNGYSSSVSSGSGKGSGNSSLGGASSGSLAGRLFGGAYNPSTGTYTLNGGSYNPSTGGYTLGALSTTFGRGTYNSQDRTYSLGTGVTVSGGTCAGSTYTAGSITISGGTCNGTTYTLGNNSVMGGGSCVNGMYNLGGGGVVAGGTCNTSTGAYTLGGNATITGGTYNASNNTYVLGSGVLSAGSGSIVGSATVTGGTYNPSTGTYTVSGGTYDSSTATYTSGGSISISTPNTGGAGTGGVGTSGTNGFSTGGTGGIGSSGATTSGANFGPGVSGGGGGDNSATTSGGVVISPSIDGGGNGGGGLSTTTDTHLGTTTPGGSLGGGGNPDPIDTNADWTADTTNDFTPSLINQIRGSNPTGSGSILNPTYLNTDSLGNGGDASALQTALGGLGISALACSGYLAKIGAAIAGAAGITAGESASAIVQVPVISITELATQNSNTAQHYADEATDFWSCLTRAIAKQLLAQMTRDIVNWINGGFNGKPAFLQNQQAFFANVANQTAGQFIAGSGLAFLCSPFSIKVKIAIAQAYATRTRAPSCTLTQVVGNVTSFMRGNFSSGGWPGIISVTTMPQNNAFGAFAIGQVQLDSRIASAQQQNGSLISATGFISQVGLQSLSDCSAETLSSISGTFSTGNDQAYRAVSSANGKVPCPEGCKCNVTTPGQVISDSLAGTNKSTFDSLNMAKSFDEIITALINQLVQKTLYEGLSHLSDNGGYGSSGGGNAQNQTASIAASVLSLLQQGTYTAQQYGGMQQDIIHDIENGQSQLNTLLHCWQSIATSTSPFSEAQQTSAQTKADTVQSQIDGLQAQVDARNAEITHTNDIITSIEQLQTQLLNASTAQQVQNIQTTYNSMTKITSSDIITAQQDRLTVQSQLYVLSDQTSKQLQQCQATHPDIHAGGGGV